MLNTWVEHLWSLQKRIGLLGQLPYTWGCFIQDYGFNCASVFSSLHNSNHFDWFESEIRSNPYYLIRKKRTQNSHRPSSSVSWAHCVWDWVR
jgi:hypothetical protein